MEKPSIILSDALLDLLAPALELDGAFGDKKTHRVILDLETGKPVKIYIERFGDARLVDVAWPQPLIGAIRNAREGSG